MDETLVLAQLKHLVGAHLVVEESPDEFAFRHALTRDAVYAGLLVRERRQFHRRIAETIERLEQSAGEGALDAFLGDLAYHYYEAGAWDKTLEFSRRAGERAQALYAPREAVDHFTRALFAAQQLGAQPPPSLYRARGQAYETVGHFEAARGDYSAALEAARQSGDGVAEWQSLIDLGFLWAARDYAETGRYFDQALDLARALGDQRLIARSLDRVGNWRINVGQPAEAQRDHLEALGIFQQLDDRPGIAATVDLLGMDSAMGADLIRGIEYLQQAIVLLKELGDRPGLASSLTARADCSPAYNTSSLASVQPLSEGVRGAEEALTIAREIGDRPAEAFALWMLGCCLGPSGEYGRALERARSALHMAQETGHRQWASASHFVLGAIHYEIFALPDALDHLEQSLAMARENGSSYWMGNSAAYLAQVHVLLGHNEEARALLDEALAPSTPPRTSSECLVWWARIEFHLAMGDSQEALTLVDLAIGSAAGRPRGGQTPLLEYSRGRALAGLGRDEDALSAFDVAQSGAGALGMRSLSWRIRAACARLHAGAGRPEQAARQAASARELIQELASTLQDASLRDNFTRRALEQLC